MKLSATKFRQNLYQVLDEILQKGVIVEIERNGEILKIIPEKPIRKLDRLESHNTIIGTPESIINVEWTDSWSEEKNL